jgi:hypothetical protein
MLIDMSDCHVTTTAVTDSYTNFLSVPISIYLPYQFVVRSVTDGRAICNSFSTVPNLTNWP